MGLYSPGPPTIWEHEILLHHSLPHRSAGLHIQKPWITQTIISPHLHRFPQSIRPRPSHHRYQQSNQLWTPPQLRIVINRLPVWKEASGEVLGSDLHPPNRGGGGTRMGPFCLLMLINDAMTDINARWNKHVSSLIKSATYHLFLLRRLKKLGTPPRELVSIYFAFVLPKLTYTSPAWLPSLNLTQNRLLEQVQKRAVRFILGPHYTTYEEAFHTLHLTTLQARYVPFPWEVCWKAASPPEAPQHPPVGSTSTTTQCQTQ